MPKLDGFAVLKQLRESEPAGEFLPVLVLTGDNTSEVRSQALKAGATDFLGKPIDHTEVTLRIKICCKPASSTGRRAKSRRNWKP